jgi:hypothetical protein
MGVNKNTTVLFREIQEEGRKLLAMGVNPKICCTNREHQQVAEKRLAGMVDHEERGHRISNVTMHALLCDNYDTACELTEMGAGRVKIGCLDKMYQERMETGKSRERRQESHGEKD